MKGIVPGALKKMQGDRHEGNLFNYAIRRELSVVDFNSIQFSQTGWETVRFAQATKLKILGSEFGPIWPV